MLELLFRVSFFGPDLSLAWKCRKKPELKPNLFENGTKGLFSPVSKGFYVFINVASMQWSYLKAKVNSRKSLQSMATNGEFFLTILWGGVFGIIW